MDTEPRTYGEARRLQGGPGWWGPPVQIEDRVFIYAVRPATADDHGGHSTKVPTLQALVDGTWGECSILEHTAGIGSEVTVLAVYRVSGEATDFRLALP